MSWVEIALPSMGEGIYEATIIEVFKKKGEAVAEDEPLFEVATDKIVTEVSSNKAGIVTDILVKKDEVAKVGQALVKIKVEEGGSQKQEAPHENNQINTLKLKSESPKPLSFASEFESKKFLSPLVRSIIKKEKISANELEAIEGTGLNERITKKDILNYLSSSKEMQAKQAVRAGGEDAPEKDVLEMTHLRKIIASNMVDSVRRAPHVTSVVEANMTEVVRWMKKNKSDILVKHGVKVTYTPIIIQCVIKALFDFPMMNISVDQEKIIKWHRINIGIATALHDGNLIVPVIKSADKLSFLELADNINSLASRARESKLRPDEIQGGTYTFSNIGVFGNLIGTPIIHQPQAAILAAGVIQKKPAVVETPQGDFVGIQHRMYLSHTFDHRAIDGALGGRFVKRVAEYLECFEAPHL